ncbi:hypothetical protein OG982_29830 [Streptomyces sp. NBC_01551]|uniref:hypothetical protein n=1 Tax=Streptomyces sp. NBC_01551 TaxID=2975876 RepID=UPI00224E4317|nr:hypothetical protein [Streptomyces sp. NBC_01551]MCX4529845.1 hypothetical protein [Streptomyces sp. NBC_01551]
MSTESGEPKREYVGFIQIAGQPEIQLRLMASSPSEATAMVVEQYGEGHVISVWNEEDARRPR